jgi:hypothetical protein
MRKLPISVLVAISTFLGTAVPVGAATVESLIQDYLPTFSTEGVCAAGVTGDVPSILGIFCILGKIISILLLAAGGVSLLFLIVGGIRYMASGGDEKAITAAKAAITYAVLGLLITLGAVFGINQILTVLLK